MDRLTYLATRNQRAAEQRRRTLGQALAEDRPAWYRIHVQYSRGGARVYQLHAWTAQHKVCRIPDGVTAQTLIDAHPEIDWWRSHDIDAVTGAVYAVPEPHEDGAIPEIDTTFGDHRPPRLAADRDWVGTVPPMPARRAA
jgi:hypothetical protein